MYSCWCGKRGCSAWADSAIAAVRLRSLSGSWSDVSTEPSAAWVRRSSSTAARSRVQAGSAVTGEGVGRGRVGEGGLGDPVDEVEPELLVVELADAVVAEQVGVGGDGDPAGAVLGDRRQRRARDRGGPVRAGDHPRAVVGVQGAGAVEAGSRDPGERVGAGALRSSPSSAASTQEGASPWWCS